MKDLKPKVTGYLEPIFRLTGATFLVPLILFTEWMILIPVPFYILVSVLSGYNPLKALIMNFLKHKKPLKVQVKTPPLFS